MKQEALKHFLKYVAIDTQSSLKSKTYPSTKKQFDLANLLVAELKELGLEDANVDSNCYVNATLKSNQVDRRLPTVAFAAHIDTAPNLSGASVRPQVIENYQGGDINLPGNSDAVITEIDNPMLRKCIGHTIVTSDGTTLLGGDDKAGIAAIVTAMSHFIQNSRVPHGDVKIIFTPDEEVGRGTEQFDIEKLNADFAYTVDGNMPGELNKETFSANAAVIEVEGKGSHTGTAKGVMLNSIKVMADIIAELPLDMAPETTEGYESFIHPYVLGGSVEVSKLDLLFRDFKTDGLEKQKKIIEKIIEKIQKNILKPRFLLRLPKHIEICWTNLKKPQKSSIFYGKQLKCQAPSPIGTLLEVEPMDQN